MTSSPGLLQHRNSASSAHPKQTFCREVLYPPPLGPASALPMSSSVAGTKPVWKFRFSCSQAACPAGWGCLWAAALLEQPALAQGCSHGAGLVFTPSSHCVPGFCWMLGALAAGSGSGVTHSAPETPPLPKGWHKSLPDGWEVTPLCCLGALGAFST